MPQITVTLDTDVLMRLVRLEKGKKSKFVNAAVKYLMTNVCWDRIDFMHLAMFGAFEELDYAKWEILESAPPVAHSARGTQYHLYHEFQEESEEE